jgi:hypothetical protein
MKMDLPEQAPLALLGDDEGTGFLFEAWDPASAALQ